MSGISKHLGQVSQYSATYSPDILVRESRTPNRVTHNVDTNTFVGYDIWNLYEVSALTNNGLPVVGFGKLMYSADSEYIVESKSLKLYFFSYNMEKLGESTEEVVDVLTQQVIIDLSALLGTPVQFKFFFANDTHSPHIPFQLTEDSKIPFNFKNIDNIDGIEDIKLTDFEENQQLLKVIYSPNKHGAALTSCFLRSNCKVTHQPDWGDIFIYYRGNYRLDELSLIKYIVSFRGESHFHEEICELVYTALLNVLQPSELMVFCSYTRRGGIDINPVRATYDYLIDKQLIDINTIIQKTNRQ